MPRKNKNVYKLKTVDKIKILLSDLKVGDILFGYSSLFADGKIFKREITCDDCLTELPVEIETHNFRGSIFGSDLRHFDDLITLNKLIKKNDIQTYGIQYCINEKIYFEIDEKYLSEYKRVDELKTIKEIKEYLKGKLKDE